jgi:hypothetical protein
MRKNFVTHVTQLRTLCRGIIILVVVIVVVATVTIKAGSVALLLKLSDIDSG